MLAPGDGSDHVQVIDARDLARFVVKATEDDLGGAFNLAGPRLTWAEFMQILGAKNPIWVDAGILRTAGTKSHRIMVQATQPAPLFYSRVLIPCCAATIWPRGVESP